MPDPGLLTDLLTRHHRRAAWIVVVDLVLIVRISLDRSGKSGCYAVRILPDDVRVDPERDGRVGVAQPFRDHMHRCDEERSCRA